MATKGLRQKKNFLVKQALYRAAMELFQIKGFTETSVDEITEKAGFSRATFFNHFGTKQGVLRLYGQRLQSLVENLLDQADPSTSPLELIRQMIAVMVREAEEHIEEVRLVCTYSMLDPDYMSNPTPARKRLFEILTELVIKAQQEGQIRRDLTAKELAMHIFFLYQGVVLAILANIDSSGSLLQSVWQFILKGVNSESPAT
jgi:AcrR family transcriptional regulator